MQNRFEKWHRIPKILLFINIMDNINDSFLDEQANKEEL